MSRHLDNLQHLILKLETRYGQEDTSVGELRAQLRALEQLERKHVKSRASQFELLAARRDFSRGTGIATATRLL